MSTTEHIRQTYDELAGRYDDYVSYSERLLLGDGRRWICAQAYGDVLEIGVGTGRNLPFYPARSRLTGVDLTPAMLDQARQRTSALGLRAHLHLGDAEALDFPDGHFDAVVMTLVLSAVPDIGRAIAEARRVLRPGGRFLALDFVRSPHLLVRTVQRLLDPRMAGRYDFHLLRDPLDHLEDAGFIIERSTRSKWGIIARVAARKSASSSAATDGN